MTLIDLVKWHKGDIKTHQFYQDVLDLALGLTGTEVKNLMEASNNSEDFLHNVENETFWMVDG